MPKLRRIVSISFLTIFALIQTPKIRASAYDAHPKLVVVMVVDQFPGDSLESYRDGFTGRGFLLFLDHGANFEDCYYDYANTEGAPGEAALGTGAYSSGNGIASDSWWDLSRNKERPVSSVEDERYHLIGLPANSSAGIGASPLNLRASTLGDSLRLATQGQARVFGISLKDRSSILAAGYSANGAFWVDPASGSFITSSYYMTALPDWAVDFNSSGRAGQARDEAGVSDSGNFLQSVGQSPAVSSYELDFARALISGEQLGKGPVTDMLMINLSAGDLSSHPSGPDSPQEGKAGGIDALDQQLDSFFTWLDKNIPGGLANVWIALSADHGVSPLGPQAAALGLPAAGIDVKKLTASLNEAMNNKFSPGENIPYMLPQQSLPYLALNDPSFQVAGINEQEAEQAVQGALPAAFASLAPPAGATLPPPPQPAALNQGNGNGANPAAPAAGEAPVPAAQAGSPAAPAGNAAQKVTAKATQKAAAAANRQSSQQARGAAQNHAGGAAAGQENASSGANTAPSAIPAPAPAPAPPIRFQPIPALVRSYTRQQLASGQLPPTDWGRLLAHSYSPNGGWYVMAIPAAFQAAALDQGAPHFSPWSYDRHVPLAFYGAPFTTGTYHGRVQPVDLAATLASLLEINHPSASIGEVLTQAIHRVPTTPAARTTGTRRRRTHEPARTSTGASPAAGSQIEGRAPAPPKKEPAPR